MIDTMIDVKLGWPLWESVTPETVENYRKELEKAKEELHQMHFTFERNLFGSPKLTRELQDRIDVLIKYCEFYREHQERQKDPNFNHWIFTKKEDIKPLYEWNKPQGEQWTKSNGKIKATIQYDRSGLMAKITLSFDDDSVSLRFLDEEKKCKSSHFKSEESIQTHVEECKTYADQFLKEHQYPRCESTKRQLDILEKLFWIVRGT